MLSTKKNEKTLNKIHKNLKMKKIRAFLSRKQKYKNIHSTKPFFSKIYQTENKSLKTNLVSFFFPIFARLRDFSKKIKIRNYETLQNSLFTYS